MANPCKTMKELFGSDSGDEDHTHQTELESKPKLNHHLYRIRLEVPLSVEERKQQARRQRQAQAQIKRYQFQPVQNMPHTSTIITEQGDPIQVADTDLVSNEEEFIHEADRIMNNQFYFQYQMEKTQVNRKQQRKAREEEEQRAREEEERRAREEEEQRKEQEEEEQLRQMKIKSQETTSSSHPRTTAIKQSFKMQSPGDLKRREAKKRWYSNKRPKGKNNPSC